MTEEVDGRYVSRSINSVSPGDILLDLLDAKRVTETDEIMEKVLNYEPINEQIAEHLKNVTGVEARAWLRMEEAFRSDLEEGNSE